MNWDSLEKWWIPELEQEIQDEIEVVSYVRK